MYASFLGISEALHLDIFRQPLGNRFFDASTLLSIDPELCRRVDRLDGPNKVLAHPILSSPLDKSSLLSGLHAGQGIIFFCPSQGVKVEPCFSLTKMRLAGKYATTVGR
jgi:hypothetical protein